MRILFVVICALLVSPALCAQQLKPATDTKPDFSGTWMIDRKKSNVASSYPDRPLRITHTDPEFRFASLIEENGQTKMGHEFVYYTDGRGEKNLSTMMITTSPDLNGAPDLKAMTESKTKWSGKKIETKSLLRSRVATYTLEFDVIDEWKLSEDGQTLTETSRLNFRSSSAPGGFMPANHPDTKKVYKRVSK